MTETTFDFSLERKPVPWGFAHIWDDFSRHNPNLAVKDRLAISATLENLPKKAEYEHTKQGSIQKRRLQLPLSRLCKSSILASFYPLLWVHNGLLRL